MDLWKTPEVEAMVSASNDAFEESVTAANQAFAAFYEALTGQAGVISDAGSRVAAQYEEVLDNHQKALNEVWQASGTLFEQSGGVGKELTIWMQREVDATQADLEALGKVESLADLQELNSKILSRYVESGLEETGKVQEMMFAAISDGLTAFGKLAGVSK
ncbi:hypothetical protein LPB41_27920 [Thalassospira sp. MA62]|nr:hypothetical protein [Thalassospira sp. MA62]